MLLENATFLITFSVLFLIIAAVLYSLAIYFFGRFFLRSHLCKKNYKFKSVKTNQEELGLQTNGHQKINGKNHALCFGEIKNLDSKVVFHTLNEINDNSDLNTEFYFLKQDQNHLRDLKKNYLGIKSKSFSDFGAIKFQDESQIRTSGLKRKKSRSDKSLVLIFNKSNLILTIDKTDHKKNFSGIELEY